jgi:carboxylesterase type B
MLPKFLSLSALLALSTAAPTTDSRLTVKASTNVLTGRIHPNFTDVREFLDVPYGVNTAGKNRFMPPKAVPLSNKAHDATEYGPVCPQYVTKIPAIWNREVPQYLQYWGNANFSAGESAAYASEDCLKLAVWTPANATSASNLPVAMVRTVMGPDDEPC